MADRLSTEQISAIVEAVGGEAGTLNLDEALQALRKSPQAIFSAEELDGVYAAVAASQRPPEAKPRWECPSSRGLFFVFEGLDRSGKSTQSKRLTERLAKDGPVKWMCFPNRGTTSGVLIDLYLRRKIGFNDKAIHQLFSANRWEETQQMLQELNNGTSLVCDRYAFSGVAYSTAKGLDFEWCQAPDVGLPVPDSVFFLYIDEKVGSSRSNFGDERYENSDMQARVRVEFQRPELRKGVTWHDVDGSQDIESIHNKIWAATRDVASPGEENGRRDLPQLWMTTGN
eukprot:CAMPEP_0170603184 /NCGR_PEP_ID=MMETSP0224-20130122/18780_1 /TAXON_ID=285029 /ORGANISM="Togula jolla, Strain CCCM 725" /LENGTH=284 /DNA_ID=CAMNT_0010928055 /DNA_START=70 /DNA_END=924 /DNA_ORIENTATION=+